MTADLVTDLHASAVDALVQEKDWGALIRYWMAHQHQPALDAAVLVVNNREDEPTASWLGPILTAFAADPLDFGLEIPEAEFDASPPSEQGALALIHLFPRLALCEQAEQYPVEHQQRLYEVGFQAIGQAIEIARGFGDPALIAMLAGVRARGNRALQELEQARDSYREAESIYRRLEEQRPGVYLAVVASTLNNLGTVQRALQELEQARDSFREAESIYRRLEEQRPGVYLADVAMTLNNLGTVQRDLQELEQARDSYREAESIYRRLEEQRPGVYLADVAMTLNNLGTVQRALQELEQARDSFREAESFYRRLESLFPTAHLPDRRRCWNNIGLLYLRAAPALGWPDRPSARDAFRQARICTERMRRLLRDSELRTRAHEQNVGVYDSLASVCVDLCLVEREPQALQEAVEVAEQGRSRTLVEMLADEALSPMNTPADLVESLRAHRGTLRRARMQMAHEETRASSAEAAPAAAGLAQLRAMVGNLEAEDRVLRERIREYDPMFDPDNPVATIDLAAIRALLPSDKPTAFVQYTLTRERAFAILITGDELDVIPLTGLALPEAMPLLQNWLRTHYLAQERWSEALPGLLAPVGELAVWPLEGWLGKRKIERVVVAPHRTLHLFPLHACKLPEGDCWLDRLEIVYTPSLSILHRCARRERPGGRQLLLVENPTNDLPFTEVEGAALRRLYHSPRAIHHYAFDAEKEKFLKDARDCDVLNYTGHAAYNLDQPLESGLVLQSKHDRSQWLTLRDIFCRLHLAKNPLVVINGCESGMTRGHDMADEVVGLPTGFLYAGARAVVSTLWRIFDLSSALLVSKFHQECLAGKQVGAALRSAQLWLRDEIPSGRHLRDELLPQLLEGVDDRKIRGECEKQAIHYEKTFPDSPPFAAEVHWAAFIASGLVYPLAGVPAAPA